MRLPLIYTEELKLTVRKNTKIFPENNFFIAINTILSPSSHGVCGFFF